jgi:hypothetical protein
MVDDSYTGFVTIDDTIYRFENGKKFTGTYIDKDGTIFTYTNGLLHSLNNEPSIIYKDGYSIWHIHGKFLTEQRMTPKDNCRTLKAVFRICYNEVHGNMKPFNWKND